MVINFCVCFQGTCISALLFIASLRRYMFRSSDKNEKNDKWKITEWKFDLTTLSTWPHSFSQVSFVAPPKHEPVVIKLGEDSDSESDRSDAESSKKKVSSNKKAGNGLFGGLEMMIKEARKSAEVSRMPIVWSDLHTVVSDFYYSMIAWYTMFSSSVSYNCTCTRLCSMRNWREPSAVNLWNPRHPAYDLSEKSKIFY